MIGANLCFSPQRICRLREWPVRGAELLSAALSKPAVFPSLVDLQRQLVFSRRSLVFPRIFLCPRGKHTGGFPGPEVETHGQRTSTCRARERICGLGLSHWERHFQDSSFQVLFNTPLSTIQDFTKIRYFMQNSVISISSKVPLLISGEMTL